MAKKVKTPTANLPVRPSEKPGRVNYCKYEQVKPILVKALSSDKTAGEIAAECEISKPTFFKYRGLLDAETGTVHPTKDELSQIGTMRAMPSGSTQKSVRKTIDEGANQEPKPSQP